MNEKKGLNETSFYLKKKKPLVRLRHYSLTKVDNGIVKFSGEGSTVEKKDRGKERKMLFLRFSFKSVPSSFGFYLREILGVLFGSPLSYQNSCTCHMTP